MFLLLLSINYGWRNAIWSAGSKYRIVLNIKGTHIHKIYMYISSASNKRIPIYGFIQLVPRVLIRLGGNILKYKIYIFIFLFFKNLFVQILWNSDKLFKFWDFNLRLLYSFHLLALPDLCIFKISGRYKLGKASQIVYTGDMVPGK